MCWELSFRLYDKLKTRADFGMKKRISVDWVELAIELFAIIVGIVIACLFPLPIFEEWPELAILLGGIIVIGVMAIGALIVHLIKRKRK